MIAKMIAFFKIRSIDFLTRTPMHGFVELTLAKSWKRKLFWIVALLVCVCILSFQLARIFQQYIKEPYITIIEKIPQDDMQYPNVSLCFRHWVYWMDFEKAAGLNFSKELVLYGASFLSDIFSQDHFDVDSTEKRFIAAMRANNFTTLSAFLKAVSKDSFIYTQEGKVEAHVEMSAYGLCYTLIGQDVVERYLSRSSLKQQKDINIGVMLLMSPFYTKRVNKISTDEYNCYIASGLKFGRRLNFSTFLIEQNKATNRHLLPTYIGVSREFQEIRAKDIFIRIRIVASVTKWQNKKNAVCDPNKLYTYDCEEQCDVIGRLKRNCTCYFVPYYASKYGHDTWIDLCRHEFFFINSSLQCSDLLVGDSKLYPLIPKKVQCELSKSHAGMCCKGYISVSKDDEIERCKKACVPGCKKWEYYISSVYRDKDALSVSEEYETYLEIIFPTSENVLFTNEIDNTSVEKFFGNIGGLLGVWMGASVLSVLQFVYLCCCNEKHRALEVNVERRFQTIESQIGVISRDEFV